MSWLPILLIVWVSLDVLIIAAVAFVARRGAIESGASSGPHPISGRVLPSRRSRGVAR